MWVDPGKHQSSSLDRFGGRHWEILSGRHRLSSPERHWQHRAQSRQTLAGFSLGRYWQTQLRASSDRTHQPSRQILEERLWVDPGKHQSSSLDRFDGRHWEILSGRHRLSSPERHWRHRAQSSQTSAGLSLERFWQTRLRASSDRTHQPIRQIKEDRLWVDPGKTSK